MTRPIAGAAAAFFLAAAAPAHAVEPQPGQWQTTVRTQVSGAAPREISHMRCVTPEMIKDPERAFMRDDAGAQRDCKRSFTKGESTLSWTVICNGQITMNGAGSMTFDSPTHYTGAFKVVGKADDQTFEIDTQMEGERIGDCAQ